jgi:hypothetical protein
MENGDNVACRHERYVGSLNRTYDKSEPCAINDVDASHGCQQCRSAQDDETWMTHDAAPAPLCIRYSSWSEHIARHCVCIYVVFILKINLDQSKWGGCNVAGVLSAV